MLMLIFIRYCLMTGIFLFQFTVEIDWFYVNLQLKLIDFIKAMVQISVKFIFSLHCVCYFYHVMRPFFTFFLPLRKIEYCGRRTKNHPQTCIRRFLWIWDTQRFFQ
jgi:hypothetical protein